MTAASATVCHYCGLPLGLRPSQRRLAGTARSFCCYGCTLAFQVRHGSFEETHETHELIRLGVGAFFAMNIMLLSLLLYSGAFDLDWEPLRQLVHIVLWLLATPAVAILGWPFVRETWQDARGGRMGSASLVVLGVGGAYGYSMLAVMSGGADVYFDTAATVLVLFTLGRYIEAAARARAARDLTPMLEAESLWVTRVEGGVETRCAIASVALGDTIRVAAGERIAIDGVILSGRACTDETVISGESRPVAKRPGDRVIAGSIDLDGPLLVRCEAAGSATQWGRICQGVRHALATAVPFSGASDRLAAGFVPVVLAIAGAVVLFSARELPLDAALSRGLAVLVVACPCALGLAAPLATALGIASLARQGCVIRDGRAIERLASIRAVIFDKTGTLTMGTPRFVALSATASRPADVLERAAGLEQHAGHALAQTVVAAASERCLTPETVIDARVVPGRGVVGTAGGDVSAIGSAEWLATLGFAANSDIDAKARSFADDGHTIAYVGWAGQMRGVLAFDDQPRPQARDTIAALHHLGLRTLVVSGDQPEATRRIAEAVAAEGWEARVSPEGKAELVACWRRNHGCVAVVGDGLNDGLALAEADVGIAMGTATDLARETASLVLPPTGLGLLAWVITLARAVRRRIIGNLLWAFSYNFIAVALAATGWLRPVMAAALMAGSSLIMVINSLRLERLSNGLQARSACS